MRQQILKACILFLVSISLETQSQDVYVSEQDWIYKYDISTCQKDAVCYIPGFGFTDIAFHPDGTLYGISAYFENSGGTKLYSLNFESCTPNLVDSFPYFSNGLVCDKDGILYFGLREFYSYDTKTGAFKLYGNLPGGECTCDFIFYNGGLYTTLTYDSNTGANGLFRINIEEPENSVLIFNDIGFQGLVAIPYDCDSTQLIGLGGGMLDINGNIIGGIIDINISLGTGNLLCNLTPFENGSSLGATSSSEFLASDPECDLLFDLDRDNSSGEFPYDFRNDAILCADAKSTHIVDSDVYLHTSADLDSIIIMLSGDLDGASEALAFSNNVANATLTFTNGRYRLTLTGDRSDAAWLAALRAIQYSNTNASPSPGLRTITFIAYNAIKSNQAQTFIRLGVEAYAGRDTSIVICASTQIDGFSQRIGGQSGGYWSPPFANSDSYNSAIDIATTYHYIVESSDCGRDTATVLIDRLPLRTLDLGPNISICRAESHTVIIPTITGDEVLWSDGNTQANRTLNTPGQYVVSVTTSDGCVITDSITISRSYNKIPRATSIDICEGEIYDYQGQLYRAGDIIIDSLVATSGCDTLLTLTLNKLVAPSISRDTTTCDNTPIIVNNKTYQIGDTISLTKSSPTGCDTVVQMVYRIYQSSIAGVLLQDTVVCKDLNTEATIDASSFSGLIWSNGAQSPTTEFGAGTHFLQATDDRGCIRTFPFEIKTYLPIQYTIESTDPSCGQNNGNISIINDLPDLPFTTSINGIITQSRENLPADNYKITLTDTNGCETQDSITLTNTSDLEVSLPSTIRGVLGQIISIAYQSLGGSIDTITFSPPSDIDWITDSIAVSINGDRVYSITFKDEYGCTVSKILSIDAEIPSSILVLPNIVSLQPTDPLNALFYLKTEGITYDMSIYDRWGNLIHNAKKIKGGDPTKAWQPSSSKVGSGVYVYLLSIFTDEGVVQKYGTVTVL